LVCFFPPPLTFSPLFPFFYFPFYGRLFLGSNRTNEPLAVQTCPLLAPIVISAMKGFLSDWSPCPHGHGALFCFLRFSYPGTSIISFGLPLTTLLLLFLISTPSHFIAAHPSVFTHSSGSVFFLQIWVFPRNWIFFGAW